MSTGVRAGSQHDTQYIAGLKERQAVAAAFAQLPAHVLLWLPETESLVHVGGDEGSEDQGLLVLQA